MKHKVKLYLCGEHACCPAVEVAESEVRIGEEGNLCTLSKDQWNDLVDKVTSGKLGKV